MKHENYAFVTNHLTKCKYDYITNSSYFFLLIYFFFMKRVLVLLTEKCHKETSFRYSIPMLFLFAKQVNQ